MEGRGSYGRQRTPKVQGVAGAEPPVEQAGPPVSASEEPSVASEETALFEARMNLPFWAKGAPQKVL